MLHELLYSILIFWSYTWLLKTKIITLWTLNTYFTVLTFFFFLHFLIVYFYNSNLIPGGTPHTKGVGMLIISLRGVNFGIWSHLGCSGKKGHHIEALIFFFGLLLSNCLNWKIYCGDHSSLSSTTTVQNELFHIYITSFHSSREIWTQ